jgi:hypothetical protein
LTMHLDHARRCMVTGEVSCVHLHGDGFVEMN